MNETCMTRVEMKVADDDNVNWATRRVIMTLLSCIYAAKLFFQLTTV